MALNKFLDLASWLAAAAVLAVPSAMLLASRAEAQPAIEAAVRAYEKAWNDCDSKALAASLAANFSGFSVRGGLSKGAEAGVDTLARQCGAGIRVNLTYEILDQDVAGDMAFVATAARGTLTAADGSTRPNGLRVTFVLKRTGAQGPWRIRNTHFSAL